MEKEFQTFRNLKTKFIYDQLTILANEILNLISITSYFQKPVVKRDAKFFEKYYEKNKAIRERLEKIRKESKDEVEKLEEILHIKDYLLYAKKELEVINKKIREFLENHKLREIVEESLKELNEEIDKILESEQQIENKLEEIKNLLNSNEKRIFLKNLENFEKKIEEDLELIEFKADSELEIIILALIHLYKRINILRFYLDKFILEIEESHTSFTEELIIFSFFNSKIMEFLEVLNLISRALVFKKENAGQPYIPSPLLDRRFRLYNLQHSVKDNFIKIISEFVKENESFFEEDFVKRNEKGKGIHFVLTSDYEIGDSVYKNSLDVALIKGSFFWREMGRSYPIMVHEIMHKVVNFIDEEKKKELSKLSEGLYTFLYRRAFFGDVGTPPFTKDSVDEITEDVVVDLFTFLIFGDAYLLALLLHGGLGFKFYDTLVKDEDKISFLLQSSKKNKKDNEKEAIDIDFTYIPTQLNYQPQRDSLLVRIRFLFLIRTYLRKLYIKNGDSKDDIPELNNISVISPEMEFVIKQYINDLFPIFEEEDLPDLKDKNKKIKFVSRTFSFMSIPQKATAELIASIVKVISEEFFLFFAKEIKENRLKLIGKFWDIKYKPNENNKPSLSDVVKRKFFYFLEKDNYLFKITVRTGSGKSKSKISKGQTEEKDIKEKEDILIEYPTENSYNLKQINIINFIWKVAIELAKYAKTISFSKNDEEKIRFLKYNVPEGRILRGFSNVNKHTYLIIKLLEKRNKELYEKYKNEEISEKEYKDEKNKLKLYLDDAIFIKSRKIYDNNKETIKNNLKNIFPNKQIIKCLALGPFDTCILRNDIKKEPTTKVLEDYLYTPIIENQAFIDRHSLLKYKDTDKENKKNKWKVSILLKFSEEIIPYRKDLLKLKSLDNRETFTYEEFINEITENFFAFSLGWEDIVLEAEGTLEEIFSLKNKLQKYKIGKLQDDKGNIINLISRTETIIFFPLDGNLEDINKENKDYKMFINIREREKKFEDKIEDENILNLRKIANIDFNVFLYPGIYDINLSNANLTEEEIVEVINTILNSKPVFVLDNYVLDAEDVVVHLTKEIKENQG